MDLKIFTENIEPQALNQIYVLAKLPVFKDCKIRIMPDVHAGTGCVIGFTANLGDKVIPNIVGVDIGCGMLTCDLWNIDIDFEKLDKTIRRLIPAGRNVREYPICQFDLTQLYCYDKLKNVPWIENSIGSLGGGNHFIEIDADNNGNKYLVIHSGSRNLGKQVAEIYQQIAIDSFYNNEELKAKQKDLIERYKLKGRQAEIQEALKELRSSYVPYSDIPKELCYLTGENRDKYLHDMKVCQTFAQTNRHRIADLILFAMGWTDHERFETIHNYIDHDTNIVRKGAISAKAEEKVLIPINMRDGCIIGIGKGNEDWNCSAPHGAGRIVSRSAAKELVSLEEYQESMKGIYTTSVSIGTIDESPMVYKPMNEIVKNIEDTVEVYKIIKPIYNFKAGED